MADENTSILDPDTSQTPGDQTDHWTGEYELDEPTAKLLSRFKTPVDAFKGYADLESYKGRSISLPKDDDKPEDKQKRLDDIYNKLGRPAKAEEYKFEKPTDLPEGLSWSDEALAEFKTVAHKMGLSQGQLEALVKYDTQRQTRGLEIARKTMQEAEAKQQAEEKAKTDKALTELKKEWGSDFDTKVEAAEKAYAVYGKNLEERVRFFYGVYLEKLKEDTLIQGAAAASGGPADFFKYEKSMGK